MTEFGTASEMPDADRAEQAPAVSGGTVIGDVPEADALDQQLPAVAGESGAAPSVGDREADSADVLEQDLDVPLDEDDIPS